MLKALLWKEWRETRMFFILMTAGVLILSLILKAIEQSNNILDLLYVTTWVIFAVLLAASQFTVESESGTSDFIMSRPVHWFKIWIIKTLYGVSAIILFGLYQIILIYLLLPSPGDLVSTVNIFLKNTPTSITPSAPFIGIILLTLILCLYFTGCIVSTFLKSSLKAALVTFVVSGFLYCIMLSSSLLLNYTSSNYIFWIIFPALFFVIFLKHQSNVYLKRASYWVLSIGGTLFWLIFAVKGTSLLMLKLDSMSSWGRKNSPFILSPSNDLFIILLNSFLISAILTSIFAFGINRKNFPDTWKSISSFNQLFIFTICISAILLEAIPAQEHVKLSLSEIVISKNRSAGIPLLVKNNPPYMRAKVSRQYFTVNKNTGEVHSVGNGKFMFEGFRNISIESNWAFYSCPALRWGIYYKWGLWAEDLTTNRQYLLMTINNSPDIRSEWFDRGSRLIILDRHSNKKTLFLVKNGKPKKIQEEDSPGTSSLLGIDINNKLYFFNSTNGIITCYNHDLIKEYDSYAVRDKMMEIISDYFQNKDSNHNMNITSIDFDKYTAVGRDGRLKSKANKNVQYVFYLGPEFSLSPDGKYLIYFLRLNSKTSESECGWVSLPDGTYNKEIQLRNVHPNRYNWLPDTGKVLRTYPRENKVDLIDLKNGISKTIIKGNLYKVQNKSPIKWSHNRKFILTYSLSETSNGRTVNLYRFNSDTLTCTLVSSKAGFRIGNFELGDPEKWSQDYSQLVFDTYSDDIWRMDLNKGNWSKINTPFKDFRLLGINNKGEVYISPFRETKIYRVTETDSKLIYER